MQVKDIMTKDPVFIDPNDNITAAARKMKKIGCGALPVGEDREHCIGIITDRDIVLRTLANGDNPKDTKVKDSMTGKVHYCQENDTLEKAADIMRQHHINRIVVTDTEKNITGIIIFGCLLWKTKNASELGHILDHAAPREAA
jgi:CBS domain-containing protein